MYMRKHKQDILVKYTWHVPSQYKPYGVPVHT